MLGCLFWIERGTAIGILGEHETDALKGTGWFTGLGELALGGQWGSNCQGYDLIVGFCFTDNWMWMPGGTGFPESRVSEGREY